MLTTSIQNNPSEFNLNQKTIQMFMKASTKTVNWYEEKRHQKGMKRIDGCKHTKVGQKSIHCK
jgi:hypothetical protein